MINILIDLTDDSVMQELETNKQSVKGLHRGLPLWLQRFLAGIGLIMLSPLLLLVVVLIKLESRGNALFSQTRVGKFGRHFKMYKFRSMYQKSDPRYQEPDPQTSDRDGVCKKYVQDPRITRVGRFIRKYSIDELPQLVNVVKGDMMLIGPRPALTEEVYQYDQVASSRLNCEAGLTGLWQISGRADTTFDEQVLLDKRYIDSQSVSEDIKVLFATIPCVLGAKGAY